MCEQFDLNYVGDIMIRCDAGTTILCDAEAALLAHFKSPLYLVEKPFFHATGINDEEDDGVVADALIVPPALAT